MTETSPGGINIENTGAPTQPETEKAKELLNKDRVGLQAALLMDAVVQEADPTKKALESIRNKLIGNEVPDLAKITKSSKLERDDFWKKKETEAGREISFADKKTEWVTNADRIFAGFKGIDGQKDLLAKFGIDENNGADKFYSTYFEAQKGNLGYFGKVVAEKFSEEDLRNAQKKVLTIQDKDESGQKIERSISLLDAIGGFYGKNSSEVAMLVAEGMFNLKNNEDEFKKTASSQIANLSDGDKAIIEGINRRSKDWDEREKARLDKIDEERKKKEEERKEADKKVNAEGEGAGSGGASQGDKGEGQPNITIRPEVALGNAPRTTEIKDGEKEWGIVNRSSDVLVVGDLFGSKKALLANLESLGVITATDGKLKWTGGDKKMVFLGDILADRNPEGFEVLKIIGDLAEQAEKDGGRFDILAGNHEDFLISFLTGRETADGLDVIEKYKDSSLGLLELCKYGSDSIKSIDLYTFSTLGEDDKAKIWENLSNDRELILKNMKNDEEGKKILGYIRNLKIAIKHDDSLFIHTDPTEEIIQTLTQGDNIESAIEAVNNIYSDGLTATLSENGELPQLYDSIRNIFLNTGNRDSFIENGSPEEEQNKLIKKLKNLGINAIFHGHTNKEKPVNERNGLLISSVDRSAYYNDAYAQPRSVLMIDKSGSVSLGEEKEQIRGLSTSAVSTN